MYKEKLMDEERLSHVEYVLDMESPTFGMGGESRRLEEIEKRLEKLEELLKALTSNNSEE